MIDDPKTKTDKTDPSADDAHDLGTKAGDEIDPQQLPKPPEEAAKDEETAKREG